MNPLQNKLKHLNPLFKNITQITENNWISLLDNLGYYRTKYDCFTSLLYSASATSVVFDKKYKSMSFVDYLLVFSIYHADYNEKLSLYNMYLLREMNIYEEYFAIDPRGLNHINCHGDKCRKTVSFRDNVWCEACHGDFWDDASSFDLLMVENIKYNVIPKKSIILLDKNITKFDCNNKTHTEKLNNILHTKKKIISKLHTKILDNNKMIANLSKQNESDKQEMEKQQNELDVLYNFAK